MLWRPSRAVNVHLVGDVARVLLLGVRLAVVVHTTERAERVLAAATFANVAGIVALVNVDAGLPIGGQQPSAGTKAEGTACADVEWTGERHLSEEVNANVFFGRLVCFKFQFDILGAGI